MFPNSHSAPALISGRAALVALLVLLCLAIPVPIVAAAAPDAVGPAPHAPTGAAVFAFLEDLAGNRTRMIQVGAVFVVIGVVLLRMSYR